MVGIYVSPHVHNYGAEKSLLTLLKEVKKNGVTPLVVLPFKGELCQLLKDNQLEYIIIPFWNWININKGTRWGVALVKYILNDYYAWRLINVIGDRNIKFVHGNSIVSSFGIQVAKKLRVPYIQHIREFGDLDFGMNFDFGKNITMKILNRNSSAIIYISQAIYTHYKEWLDEDKGYIVYNGVEYKGKKSCDFVNNNKIIEIGRLSEEKGQSDLIEAIYIIKNKYKEFVLVDFYGDGSDYKNKLIYLVEKLGLENQIFFQGYKENINIENYSLGITTSKYEAFGRVTVEYMLHGLPVIGTNSGGTKELICENETGYLYDYGDVENLAELIYKIMKNKSLAKKMGENAQKRAINKFSVQQYSAQILNIYHTL